MRCPACGSDDVVETADGVYHCACGVECELVAAGTIRALRRSRDDTAATLTAANNRLRGLLLEVSGLAEVVDLPHGLVDRIREEI